MELYKFILIDLSTDLWITQAYAYHNDQLYLTIEISDVNCVTFMLF